MTFTLASIVGTLAVAVAAVVVVLAIIAVIIMVLRSNGGRQASGGIGYDARQRGMSQSPSDYDSSASPWSRQANRAAPAPMANDPAGNYGAPARTSGANWGATPPDQPAPGAWGAPSGPNYGQSPAVNAGANGTWNGGGAGWNGGSGAPAMGGAPLAQNQAPWDASGGPSGARPWDNQGTPPWAAPQQPANGNWGQPDPSMMPGNQWGGAPAAVEQPAAPGWGAPPAGAAPAQNAWGIPSAGPAPAQNAWGVPAGAGAPAADAWGVPAAPTSPNNWGQPATNGGQGAWASAPQGGGYDAPPAAMPYGNEPDPRQRQASGGMGAVVVRAGKDPGRIYEIRGDRLTIGRSRDSDIFLEDLAVSRLHATIYRDPNGQYIVHDEGSANGTTVNGQRISDYTLEENDEIGLGQTVLAFVRH